MIVLAIDTTSQQGGAGVFRDAKALAIVANERPANLYSVTLFDMTAQTIQTAGVTMQEIDLYAVANGPGSFTGIRVGLAAVQGWARAFGRPAIGVSNLRAMVQAGSPDAELAFPIVDARRGEFFVGRFRRVHEESSPERTFGQEGEGLVIKRSEIEDICGKMAPANPADIAWLVRESDSAAVELRDQFDLPGRWITVRGTLLSALAAIGAREHCNGRLRSPDELQPQYIRRPDAELNWQG
jgi:tRNA threonylcarbamoyladenosine biosynthesis protein TsaB